MKRSKVEGPLAMKLASPLKSDQARVCEFSMNYKAVCYSSSFKEMIDQVKRMRTIANFWGVKATGIKLIDVTTVPRTQNILGLDSLDNFSSKPWSANIRLSEAIKLRKRRSSR